MNRDDVLRLAEQADEGDEEAMFTDTEGWITRFAALVMEECAGIAFNMPLNSSEERHEYRWTDTYKCAALECAAAIRAAKPKG